MVVVVTPASLATPLPSSPTRGEVLHRVFGSGLATSTPFTSPLVGEVGRGEAPSTIDGHP